MEEACRGGSDSLCSEGYEGKRCGVCADGFYLLQRKCKACPSDGVAMLLLVLMIVLALGICGMLVLITLKDPYTGSAFLFVVRLAETLGLFGETAFVWPSTVSSLIAVAAVVNFNTQLFAIECIIGRSTAQSSVIMGLLAPLAGIAVFVAMWLCLEVMCHIQQAERSGFPPEALETFQHEPLSSAPINKIRSTSSTSLHIRKYNPMQLLLCSTRAEQQKLLTAAYCKLMLSAYPFFAVQFISTMVGCKQLEDGVSRLVRFSAEDCHDDHWWEVLLPLSVVGLLLYCCGIPLLGLILIKRKGLSAFDQFLIHTCFAGYRNMSNGYLWVLTIKLRSLVIALVAFLPLSAQEQFAILAILLLVTIFLEARVSPRPQAIMNLFESLEEILLLLVLLMGNLYMALPESSSIYHLPAVVSWTAITLYAGASLTLYGYQVLSILNQLWKKTTTTATMISVAPAPAE